MTLSRRTLLAASGLGLASLVLEQPARATLRGSTTADGTAGHRFPGDPGRGNLYYGSSLQYGRSLPAWEARLGCTLGVHHNYFQPQNIAGLLGQARDDVANDRLPHLSVTPPGTWRAVADGQYDGWIDQVLGGLAQVGWQVFLTVNPEPESDAGSDGRAPADFVAMQDHLIAKNVATPGSRVTIVPVLMAWTFNPKSGRDIDSWYVRGASVMGVDVYNPWGPHNGSAWRSLAELMPDVLAKVGSKPIAIAEYGCRTNPADPSGAAQWMQDAYHFAVNHNVVSMSYFNSDVGSPEGSWVLDKVRGRVFKSILNRKTARIR